MSSMAKQRRLDDFRALGVYVQREFVVSAVLRALRSAHFKRDKGKRDLVAAVANSYSKSDVGSVVGNVLWANMRFEASCTASAIGSPAPLRTA